MLKKIVLLLISILLPEIMTGCAESVHLSGRYGKSYDTLFQAQVVNPDAPDDSTPVKGMRGYTAVQIYNDVYLPGLTETEKSGN